jgi:hypothetical protein
VLKKQSLSNDRKSKKRPKYKHNTNTKLSIYSVQQTAVLGTSHIIRKVLRCETGVLSGGGSCLFRGRGSGERRVVTGDSMMIMMLMMMMLTN